MPPRFAYWTIIVDDKPTSFRSGAVEDLLPTFNRLKAKNPSAVMMWFQNGKLWPTRLDAQEAMRARGDIGRRSDPRQGSEDRGRNSKPEWKPRSSSPKPQASSHERPSKLDWKPKGASAKPQWTPKSANAREEARRDWKPKPYTPKADAGESSTRPEWKPKGSFKPEASSRGEPKGSFTPQPRRPRPDGGKPEWKSKGSFAPENRKPKADSRERSSKLDWKPKGSFDRGPKPDWKAKRAEGREPKAESREPKAEGGPEFRDRKRWRPGGDHKDPRQKYKDAKKSKWTKFKQTIRARSASAAKPLRRDKSTRPPKKRER